MFTDVIGAIEWSPDDSFIYAVIPKKTQIMVRCLNPEAVEGGKEGWSCKIDECFLGLVGQMWGPDSR